MKLPCLPSLLLSLPLLGVNRRKTRSFMLLVMRGISVLSDTDKPSSPFELAFELPRERPLLWFSGERESEEAEAEEEEELEESRRWGLYRFWLKFDMELMGVEAERGEAGWREREGTGCWVARKSVHHRGRE